MMERVTVRFPPEQIEELDDLADREGYPNRSEAVRQAVRDMIEEHSEAQSLEKTWAKV